MKLQHLKSQSLTEQVKNHLYDYIKSFKTDKNEKLPKEEELAVQLGVSRITIRKVLTELEQEGLIFRKRGKGTFINADALTMKVPFAPAKDFRHIIEQSGYAVKVELINVKIERASDAIAKALKIAPQEEIVCVEKMFYADNNPAIYSIDRFSRSLISGDIEVDELSQSIYRYILSEALKQIIWDKTEIYTTTNRKTQELTQLFDMKDEVDSFLVCEVVEYDKDNVPVLFNHEYFNTDYIRFHQIRQKQVY